MNRDKIKTLLLGIASINRMLIEETNGNDFWDAVTDELSFYIRAAGVELEDMYRKAALAEADTEEFAPVIVGNFVDTREIPAVVVYDAEGRKVS